MAEKITVFNGELQVPDTPIIPYIEGDGIGPDISSATKQVVDRGVMKAYGGRKQIAWKEVLAGEKAHTTVGDWLPEDTLSSIRDHVVAIKGPLTTPVGEGFRSLNVALRQKLDLYACVRPVSWMKGVPSPVVNPELLDIVIYRENTEDIYKGIEWHYDSQEAGQVAEFLEQEMSVSVPKNVGIGIKLISEEATKRLMEKAIKYALTSGRKTITIVHKGNIMKYTEGQFANWCYEAAKANYRDKVITEDENQDNRGDRILINDRIADNMFQQLLTRSNEYDVLVSPNLNGDYLSDAAAAQVGGLGLAPGANIGDSTALFEATHGTAPKYAGMDKVNPCSLILSASMMLEYIGWDEARDIIESALETTISNGYVTYDLGRHIDNCQVLSTSKFAAKIIENMG